MKQTILAVSGEKNSGKTTLIEGLIPLLTASGLEIAVIKHDGHSFEADVKGTDTERFFSAGASGTAVYDGEKFMIVKRVKTDAFELAKLFPDADLILIEGLKYVDMPKLKICSGCVTGTFFEDTLSRDGLREIADKIISYAEAEL